MSSVQCSKCLVDSMKRVPRGDIVRATDIAPKNVQGMEFGRPTQLWKCKECGGFEVVYALG